MLQNVYWLLQTSMNTGSDVCLFLQTKELMMLLYLSAQVVLK